METDEETFAKTFFVIQRFNNIHKPVKTDISRFRSIILKFGLICVVGGSKSYIAESKLPLIIIRKEHCSTIC